METETTTPPSFNSALQIAGLDLESVVDANCNQCQTPIGKVLKTFASAVCCKSCVEQYEHDRRISEIKEWWKNFCPKLYAETDVKHEDFARIWPIVKAHTNYKQNLILCGASGKCKSRAMMHRLKLALIKGHSIDVLWADKLDEAIESRKMSKLRDRLVEPSILGIDDFLTSGSALETVTKFLKGIIDIRLRDGKTTILTTNLGARDIETDSQKFNNATKADRERVQALIRRLRGEFKTVDVDAGIGDGRF